MFEAKLETSATMKNVLEAIKDLLSEATFDCNETGIHIQAMDKAHSALVNLTLRAGGFSSYRCDRNISMGIGLTSMSKIFKTVNNKDTMIIRHDEDRSPDVVTFVFESNDFNRHYEYNLKLMHLDAEALEIPADLDVNCKIQLQSAEFAKICRDLSQFGENIEISFTNAVVKFSSNSEIGSGNVTLFQSSAENGSCVAILTMPYADPVPIRSYASKYLNYFAKAASFSPRVQLSLSAEMPLVVEYCIPELGEIIYYLAPKVDESQDETNQMD